MIGTFRARVSPGVLVSAGGILALWAAGALALLIRYFWGLGAATNLSDRVPWGLWIGFDVMSGVALAAGGFVVAGAVYILGREKYRPILRPAVLTAFLGYVLVIMGLLVDLGLPWNIWHALVMWQPHSVMFEVAWCVMLYTTVLALEFSPVVFERFRFKRLLRIMQYVTPILVVLGVILSTLHQSSLGSLFLIVPSKLYPLWYSPLLPVLFFASAVCVGLAMVILESTLSARAFKRGLEEGVIRDLAWALAWTLVGYAVLKFGDLALRGQLGRAVAGSSIHTTLFWLEAGIGLLLPMALLLRSDIRQTPKAIFWCSAMVIFGVVLNRLNVSVFGLWPYNGYSYLPSLAELVVTLTLVSGGVAVFALAAKYLPVFTVEKHGAHR